MMSSNTWKKNSRKVSVTYIDVEIASMELETPQSWKLAVNPLRFHGWILRLSGEVPHISPAKKSRWLEVNSPVPWCFVRWVCFFFADGFLDKILGVPGGRTMATIEVVNVEDCKEFFRYLKFQEAAKIWAMKPWRKYPKW